ncbi:hypothetical protein VTP01DRAFT_5548 [Rhizomucor pusillus]|uniref:uncharacterized protein n=1 Tax=Rhizomucor pusillus TaxID=4840 RepID=UPI003743D546
MDRLGVLSQVKEKGEEEVCAVSLYTFYGFDKVHLWLGKLATNERCCGIRILLYFDGFAKLLQTMPRFQQLQTFEVHGAEKASIDVIDIPDILCKFHYSKR